ncbi:hypothetical protein GCM10007856_03390 [Azospirillum oryzae]|nr:hypothetical protein GCM10007856_03390 [Azospirillum oryzae]
MTGGLAAEARRNEDRRRIGVEQGLLVIEPLPLGRGARSVDAIGIVGSAVDRGRGQPAVPDAATLVAAGIEGLDRDRINRILCREKQQGDGSGML